jgi:ABC-type multidrug transport system ATPase subunit
MIEIPLKLKTKILKEILSQPDNLGVYQRYDGIIDFLNLIWPLREMPSEDSRYKNAEEDAYQHLVNNSDWEYDYLFEGRLKILESDEYFNKFTETIVNPTVRENRESIVLYVAMINRVLSRSEFKLSLVDHMDELPVYRLRVKSTVRDIPEDIVINSIPFYHAKSTGERQYPHFYLSADNWDDFGNRTTFNLRYVEGTYLTSNIGKLKIMEKDAQITLDILPDSFTILSPNFCSLGDESNYYHAIKRVFSETYQSVLLALRDVAFFPKIHEEFEHNDIYKASLIRFNQTEQMARTIRFEMNGIELSECFKFSYVFTPPYSQEPLQLDFRFQYLTTVEHRVFALIGKNGTGKTLILANLAKQLSQSNPEGLFPRKPLYGKIFTVSYSIFDHFNIPNSDASFNYVYCGIRKPDNTFLTEEEIMERILSLSELIRFKNLETKWFRMLRNFVPVDLLSEIFAGNEQSSLRTFQPQYFPTFYRKLSSGQNILVMILSEILSQIRLNSLILYDEPETHLHPNAITLLMNAIFELVSEFESFCIIATHSPLVIQEIQARNVIIIERENDLAYLRQMDKESFGENLTVITEDIFGNSSIAKHHLLVIANLVERGESFESILDLLSSENLPMNLNTRLYIKGLISERDEKS